jgi:PAS domain S-box-containing protein
VLDLTLRRRRRSREQVAQLERQLTDERAEAQRALSAAAEELRLAEERYGDLQRTLTSEREEHERRQVASETELTRLNAEYDQARRSLDHLGISFAALERVATENAAERARLESVVADRDAQLRAQVERHVAAERAAAGTIETLRQELQAARSQAARLQEEAERAAVLQKQLDDSQKESRRLFEKAPYGLCRFMSDGAFIKANHSFARLLGYRKADDLRTTSLGSFFECVADLRWVLERAVGTAATKTIETALKTRSGRRVEVRLHALSHVDGTVDVGVQDLTAVRALEARLREAQRMEAVGRLASEVAVTCDMVLRDVTHGGRQWLAAIDSDQQLRDRGELLLDEVTRAAAFLKQFSVYGRKEIDALAPVSVQRVIRDLAPVLKRVAGDHIDWVVPKMSAPVEVDVDAERLERVLVNVASYARARMPQGGRVKIDVATTVLSRDFTARYPNVRPGPHVLITIAEVSGGRHRGRTDSDAEPSAALAAPRPTSDTTGVDLGALLALLGDCGGHLWIAAERSGNMTLKVHLPRRMPHDAADPAAPATRAQRVRQLAGWFRH